MAHIHLIAIIWMILHGKGIWVEDSYSFSIKANHDFSVSAQIESTHMPSFCTFYLVEIQ